MDSFIKNIDSVKEQMEFGEFEECFFRAKARELNNSIYDDWDILFYMQHHGIKPRLLDWSDSFSVAVYFAL